MLQAIQQQLERMNVVFNEIQDQMDRQDAVIATWHEGHPDENQQASLKDPLHVPVRPSTRARSKMIKEALSGPIQEIWVGSKTE
jgi:hypothetical protein